MKPSPTTTACKQISEDINGAHQRRHRLRSVAALILIGVALSLSAKIAFPRLLPQQCSADDEAARRRSDGKTNVTDGESPSSIPIITANSTEYQAARSCDIDDAGANNNISSATEEGCAATYGLRGEVSDCRCTFDAIERANADRIHPLLQRIVETPFFAHFKMDLCSECELWKDEMPSMCMLRDCGVCECEEPPGWARDAEWMPHETAEVAATSEENDDCGGKHVDDRVTTTGVDTRVTDGWTTTSAAPSIPMFFDESPTATSTVHKEDADTTVVVDLRLNPERYTGYAGRSAERVWSAIHQDNCFRQAENHEGEVRYDDNCTLPTEQRVYNRIVSGMHSSISLHIARGYCLEMDPNVIAECRTWGPNAALADERVLSRKDRLENLYVAFAVLLRAVQRAGSAIAAAVPPDDPFYAEGLSEWTDVLLPEVVRTMESLSPTFDERSLFAPLEEDGATEAVEEDGAMYQRRRRGAEELERRFAHLLRIMECVGCDRCKLWGTLQALGVGTALRVVGLDEDEAAILSRQEAVALVHTLERFSSALVYAREFAGQKEI